MIYLEHKKNVALNLKSWEMTAEVYDLDTKITIWKGPVTQHLVELLQSYIGEKWLPTDFYWKKTKRTERGDGHRFTQYAVDVNGKRYLMADVELRRRRVQAHTSGWQSFFMGLVLGMTRLTFWESMAVLMLFNRSKKRDG
jgi:hypothetical protein